MTKKILSLLIFISLALCAEETIYKIDVINDVKMTEMVKMGTGINLNILKTNSSYFFIS